MKYQTLGFLCFLALSCGSIKKTVEDASKASQVDPYNSPFFKDITRSLSFGTLEKDPSLRLLSTMEGLDAAYGRSNKTGLSYFAVHAFELWVHEG